VQSEFACEDRRDTRVAARRRMVQRRETEAVAREQRRPVQQQQPDERKVPRVRCESERRHAVAVALVKAGAVREEDARGTAAPPQHRPVERRARECVDAVELRWGPSEAPQQRPEHAVGARARRCEEERVDEALSEARHLGHPGRQGEESGAGVLKLQA